MVDSTGLENRRTETYRGFESLSFRRKKTGSGKRNLFLFSLYGSTPDSSKKGARIMPDAFCRYSEQAALLADVDLVVLCLLAGSTGIEIGGGNECRTFVSLNLINPEFHC